MDVLEILKVAGSIAGLGSAAFLVYDRVVKDRPVVSLGRQSYGANGQAFLRIVNPANDQLVITKITCAPPAIGIAESSSVRGVADAVISAEISNLVISDNGEASLPIVKRANFANTKDVVHVRVQWRHTRHHWPFLMSSTLRVTADLIRELESAKPVGRRTTE